MLLPHILSTQWINSETLENINQTAKLDEKRLLYLSDIDCKPYIKMNHELVLISAVER